MGIIRTICLWILVALLCVSFTFSLDYSKFGEEEAFLNQLVYPATGEIDENLAELLWISCRQDLNDINEAFEDPNSHLPRETLHPELKQALSDCIRKNNNLFQVSGEDNGFKTWYSRYFESLFHWHEVSRRALATQSIAVAPVPNLGPSPSPAPAPSPTSESPRLSPESPPSLPLPLAVPSNQAAPPINDLPDSISPANRDPTHGGTDNSRTIIIACVVTAVVTSVFVALFFFLYCRRGSAAKQNDERPLLSLSLNEFSCGSSLAYAFGTNDSSIHKKASTNGNVYIESNAHQISFDGKSSFGAVAAATTKTSSAFPDKPSNANHLLPLPPGRVGASRPGLPPLKSPPDRADPLPPEPPAPIRASLLHHLLPRLEPVLLHHLLYHLL